MMYHWPNRRETAGSGLWHPISVAVHFSEDPAGLRASLLSRKPLNTCPALAHSALSCSTGVWSDLGKEGKDKLFRAMTKYNPKSEKVGTVWKTQIKKESSDF